MIGRLWRFAKEHCDTEDIGANPAAEVAAIHTKHRVGDRAIKMNSRFYEVSRAS